MLSGATFGVPVKSQITVAKYHGDDTSGEPYEVAEIVNWYEADGALVTDPDRIAELERRNGAN